MLSTEDSSILINLCSISDQTVLSTEDSYFEMYVIIVLSTKDSNIFIVKWSKWDNNYYQVKIVNLVNNYHHAFYNIHQH